MEFGDVIIDYVIYHTVYAIPKNYVITEFKHCAHNFMELITASL